MVVKVLVIITTFLCFLLSIICFMLIILGISTGSFCNVNERILITNDFHAILHDLDLEDEVDKEMVDILNSCVVFGKSGDFSHLINDFDFE